MKHPQASTYSTANQPYKHLRTSVSKQASKRSRKLGGSSQRFIPCDGHSDKHYDAPSLSGHYCPSSLSWPECSDADDNKSGGALERELTEKGMTAAKIGVQLNALNALPANDTKSSFL